MLQRVHKEKINKKEILFKRIKKECEQINLLIINNYYKYIVLCIA